MAIDKLTKVFKDGDVLYAGDLNPVVDKVNELVDAVNEGGGGGSDIPDGAVTTAKLADGAVTESKTDAAFLTKVLKTGYKFLGVAAIADTPAVPTQNVVLIASEAGTYSGYGLTVSQSDGVCAFLYDVAAATPAWVKLPLGIPFGGGGSGMTAEEFTGVLLQAQADRYYRGGEAVNSLTVQLPAMSGNDVKSIILGITTGSTPLLNFTAADGKAIRFVDGWLIKASSTYEINILYNGLNWTVAYVVISN